MQVYILFISLKVSMNLIFNATFLETNSWINRLFNHLCSKICAIRPEQLSAFPVIGNKSTALCWPVEKKEEKKQVPKLFHAKAPQTALASGKPIGNVTKIIEKKQQLFECFFLFLFAAATLKTTDLKH